jgi:hypothetical protein
MFLTVDDDQNAVRMPATTVILLVHDRHRGCTLKINLIASSGVPPTVGSRRGEMAQGVIAVQLFGPQVRLPTRDGHARGGL